MRARWGAEGDSVGVLRLWGICVAIAALVGAASVAAAKPIDVSGNSVLVGWDPASGPVAFYVVWVARDGGEYRGEVITQEPRARIAGETGERARMIVAGVGVTSGKAVLGPSSPPSAELRFAGPPEDDGSGSGGSDGGTGSGDDGGGDSGGDGDTDGGNGSGSDGDTGGGSGSGGSGGSGNDGGGDTGDSGGSNGGGGSGDDGLGLPDYASEKLVEMERTAQVLGTGDFLGNGRDDVLFRFAGDEGVFVLDVSGGAHLVTWKAATAFPGTWRGDRHIILVHTPAGNLEAWAFESDGPGSRWGVAQSGLQVSMAADLSGDGVEDVLRRFADGSLRLSDASQLPMDLRSDDRVLVADANGDGRDDVVVADLPRGDLDIWLEGRRLRRAPSLESNLEDLEVAWLEGAEGGPWLVGVDSGGRIRARPLEERTTRTLGTVAPGTRVHPLDVDGDGTDELLLAGERELSVWRPEP